MLHQNIKYISEKKNNNKDASSLDLNRLQMR